MHLKKIPLNALNKIFFTRTLQLSTPEYPGQKDNLDAKYSG
jgi:hypothetical protein